MNLESPSSVALSAPFSPATYFKRRSLAPSRRSVSLSRPKPPSADRFNWRLTLALFFAVGLAVALYLNSIDKSSTMDADKKLDLLDTTGFYLVLGYTMLLFVFSVFTARALFASGTTSAMMPFILSSVAFVALVAVLVMFKNETAQGDVASVFTHIHNLMVILVVALSISVGCLLT